MQPTLQQVVDCEGPVERRRSSKAASRTRPPPLGRPGTWPVARGTIVSTRLCVSIAAPGTLTFDAHRVEHVMRRRPPAALDFEVFAKAALRGADVPAVPRR